MSFNVVDTYAKIARWEWGGTTSFEIYVECNDFNGYSRLFEFSDERCDAAVALYNVNATREVGFDVLKGSNSKYIGTDYFYGLM